MPENEGGMADLRMTIRLMMGVRDCVDWPLIVADVVSRMVTFVHNANVECTVVQYALEEIQ